MILFFTNVFFPPKLSFVCKKNQKNFKFGKIRKFPEKRVFIGKKRCKHSKKHLCKGWRAENMPVVAGRPVTTIF